MHCCIWDPEHRRQNSCGSPGCLEQRGCGALRGGGVSASTPGVPGFGEHGWGAPCAPRHGAAGNPKTGSHRLVNPTRRPTKAPGHYHSPRLAAQPGPLTGAGTEVRFRFRVTLPLLGSPAYPLTAALGSVASATAAVSGSNDLTPHVPPIRGMLGSAGNARMRTGPPAPRRMRSLRVSSPAGSRLPPR